jgi:O-antigen ligase
LSISKRFFSRDISFQWGWAGLAAALGVLVATQPLTPLVIAMGIAAVGLLALFSPLITLIIMLVLAPLRTLIATEAPVQFPLDIGQIALIGVGAGWLAYVLPRRQPLIRLAASPLYLPLGVFIVISGLTVFSALSISAWLSEWLKWVQILLLVILVLHIGRWQWLVFGVTLAGAANAVIGIYEFFGGSGALHLLINDRFFRAFGTFGQPNPFGGFMGLIAPLAALTCLGYTLRLWTIWRHSGSLSLTLLGIAGFYALAAGLMSIALIMSWSRGAWLGFAAAVFVILFALPRRWWQSLTLLMVSIGLISVLWLTNRLPSAIVERVNSATEEIFAFNDVRGVDITPANYAVVERLAHWQAALNMAQVHPWLGVGLGNYEAAYAHYRLLNWKFPLGHAHNYYLNVLAETGMIGLISYSTLWASIIGLTWQARRHPDTLTRCVIIGLLGTWTYLTVHSLTDNLYVNNLFLHIGVMLGLLAYLNPSNRFYTHESI